MAHWHDFNPWAKHIIYLSYDEMREILGDKFYSDEVLAAYGSKLDAYLLPFPRDEESKRKGLVLNYSFGIRYGAEDDNYLSPPVTKAQGDAVLRNRAAALSQTFSQIAETF